MNENCKVTECSVVDTELRVNLNYENYSNSRSIQLFKTY